MFRRIWQELKKPEHNFKKKKPIALRIKIFNFRDLGRKHFCQAGNEAESFIQAKHKIYH